MKEEPKRELAPKVVVSVEIEKSFDHWIETEIGRMCLEEGRGRMRAALLCTYYAGANAERLRK